MKYLDHFPVVLLDMNGTFMFGEDRFGFEHDYNATYRELGGQLASERVHAIIRACYNHLEARYHDPAFHNRFPKVKDTLSKLPEADGLDEIDLERLERTFALHELGHIPAAYAAALKHLATKHRLGLVADIWSEKKPWLGELKRAGVLELFEAIVFSSDIGCVKPSPHPFLIATERLKVGLEACVMIGDSVRRDIRGAKAVGISTVWIGQDSAPLEADWDIRDLLELVE